MSTKNVDYSAIETIRERLVKVEALIPDPQYATLFQSMRNDIRILLTVVDSAAAFGKMLPSSEFLDELKSVANAAETTLYPSEPEVA